MREIINKPWGKEVWLELNDKYCYKRIYINAGHRTSYQYHEKKLETNYVISGKAEFWIEGGDIKGIKKIILKEGEYITIEPHTKHRVCAITDIVLQEVSTSEVDDVIRLEDDTHRKSGRIESEHSNPALCIVAAGRGTRLKSLGEQIHKGLLPMNNKAVISHIIDKTPEEFDIIVAIGYKGNMIKEYCAAAHPDRLSKMTFVEIDNIDGKGSGPGYSTLMCKEHLQRPFYWITSDCIIDNDLPLLDNNWLGLYPTSIPEIYSTAQVDSDMNIVSFKNKDKNGHDYAYIGLAGILDFETFWKELETNMGTKGEVVSAFYNIRKYKSFKAKMLDWYDVGTIESYMKAKKLFGSGKQYSIPKTSGEFLYVVDDNFIKLFSDSEIVKNRASRGMSLAGIVPNIEYVGTNVYSYKWIDGQTLYEANDIDVWKRFIDWIEELWIVEHDVNLREPAEKFYTDKTLRRLERFLGKKDSSYFKEHIINDLECRGIYEHIDKIDWEKICDVLPTRNFHGDLQFDNAMIDNNDNFFLVDWRQDFGGCIEYGDIYYDLAKLYGGMIMSYQLMKDDNNFKISKLGNHVDFEYNVPENLSEIRQHFEKWLMTHHTHHSYDFKKVKILTALIFLNMSPLHNYPLDDLLFFQSSYMLQELL
jgi:choline kinase/mannose-6-phosphate isomerase-like protein (cupin superfamily)